MLRCGAALWCCVVVLRCDAALCDMMRARCNCILLQGTSQWWQSPVTFMIIADLTDTLLLQVLDMLAAELRFNCCQPICVGLCMCMSVFACVFSSNVLF